MDIEYVHVKWPDGADDMVPASTAHIRAEVGDFEIVDPTPARWRAFKPRLPLGEPASPKQQKTTRVVTEPAPIPGASTAEEATK